jgi:hypothetical protein
LLTAVIAMLVHGYHPGVEDDGVYLSAIHHNLNPALYPHDADFFSLQLQATIFDKVIATSVRLTHIPLSVALLLCQGLTIFLLLLGCLHIARRCFSEAHAQWAAVCTVAALLTLPVSGTALYLVDQYVHPRAFATVAVLFAITAILDRRYWRAALLLLIGFLFHPLMGSFGISYCLFLSLRTAAVPTLNSLHAREATSAAALLPLGWILQPTSTSWHRAAETRDYYFLGRWTWYEWLGVFAPFLLLYLFSRLGRRAKSNLEFASQQLMLFGLFQVIVAVVVMLPVRLERLRPFQPMRYLHLLYLLLMLFAGGLIGQYLLRRSAVRWLLLFVPLCAGMFIAQRQVFPASSHIEISAMNSRNQWVQAFFWVRDNTPQNAYFALDPYYMQAPGEDYHSFRALAERSALADYVKDPSVVTQVPELGPRWEEQVQAANGWQHFQLSDFQALKTKFGVNWVLLQNNVADLDCPYHNRAVSVCRIE